VHLCACTFEEDATASDEECVARKDHTTCGLGRGRGRVGHVVADRVLGVAGRCETSSKTYPGGWVGSGWVGLAEVRCRKRKIKKIWT
jgi:hypothetical protein